MHISISLLINDIEHFFKFIMSGPLHVMSTYIGLIHCLLLCLRVAGGQVATHVGPSQHKKWSLDMDGLSFHKLTQPGSLL